MQDDLLTARTEARTQADALITRAAEEGRDLTGDELGEYSDRLGEERAAADRLEQLRDDEVRELRAAVARTPDERPELGSLLLRAIDESSGAGVAFTPPEFSATLFDVVDRRVRRPRSAVSPSSRRTAIRSSCRTGRGTRRRDSSAKASRSRRATGTPTADHRDAAQVRRACKSSATRRSPTAPRAWARRSQRVSSGRWRSRSTTCFSTACRSRSPACSTTRRAAPSRCHLARRPRRHRRRARSVGDRDATARRDLHVARGCGATSAGSRRRRQREAAVAGLSGSGSQAIQRSIYGVPVFVSSQLDPTVIVVADPKQVVVVRREDIARRNRLRRACSTRPVRDSRDRRGLTWWFRTPRRSSCSSGARSNVRLVPTCTRGTQRSRLARSPRTRREVRRAPRPARLVTASVRCACPRCGRASASLSDTISSLPVHVYRGDEQVADPGAPRRTRRGLPDARLPRRDDDEPPALWQRVSRSSPRGAARDSCPPRSS